MLASLFFAFWFFAPAALSNVSAFFSSKLPVLRDFNQPVDAGLTFRGKRILGSHKTIRGFVFGTFMAIIGVYIQLFLYMYVPFFHSDASINYNEINPFILGFLLGFGALAGDAVKSFFKRQLSIPPGKSWVPFDQVDYLVGGLFFSYFYIHLSTFQYLFLIIVWFLLHPTISFFGYLLRLKKDPI